MGSKAARGVIDFAPVRKGKSGQEREREVSVGRKKENLLPRGSGETRKKLREKDKSGAFLLVAVGLQFLDRKSVV